MTDHHSCEAPGEAERAGHVAMKQRSEGASKMAARAMQRSPERKGGTNPPPTVPRPEGRPGATKPPEPYPESTGRLQLSLGSVVDIQGLRLQLSYINTGTGRLTFTVLNREALVVEAPRDPIVGVG